MPKPSVPHSKIQAMLQERWGPISSFSPLTEGLDSQAFGFRHGAAAYVVRINQSIVGFEKDLFVYDRFASPTLPIPEVLDIGHLDDKHAFCISRRAPGVRLQDVDALRLLQLVGPTAWIMATIAASDIGGTNGFGRFDATGSGPYESWQDFLTSIADSYHYDWEKAGRSAEMRTVSTLFRLVEKLAAYCPEERCLIHGDFGSCNVLTDGHRITAVIDWDRALLGDPLYDVANVFFWHEERMRQQIQYFESHLNDVPQWHERILCYQLRIGLQKIYESAIEVGPINVEWLMTRCRNIVDQTAAT